MRCFGLCNVSALLRTDRLKSLPHTKTQPATQFLKSVLLAAGLMWICTTASSGEPPGKWWKRFADIPRPVFGATTVVLNTKIHVLGGSQSDAHQVFDPAKNTWELKAPLPHAEGIGWGMAAPFKAKIYFFGGGYGKTWRGDDRAFVYDPATDKWSPIAPMPIRRMQGAAVATKEAIYIIGGHQGTQQISREEEIKTTYKYDSVKDTYTKVADMPESGIFIVFSYYKGNIYVIPGVERTVKNPTDAGQGYVWADGLMKYNPAKDFWTKLDVPRPFRNAWAVTQQSSHVALGPKLFLAGGATPPDRRRTDFVAYFDMDQGKFFEVGRLPRVRCCAGGGVVNGKLYIVGGFYNETGDPCPETWGYPFSESASCCTSAH